MKGKNNAFYIYDYMLLIENAKVISEKSYDDIKISKNRLKDISEIVQKENKDLFLSFEDFCKDGCEEVQSLVYDKKKRQLKIQGYSRSKAIWVNFLFSCDNIHYYWNENEKIGG